MAEFQEGTLDTLMERLCNSISGFDPEWVTRCVPATEEQIQQLQDILANQEEYRNGFHSDKN